MSEHLLSEKVQIMANRIGQFYLQKNNGDYVACNKELDDLRISKLLVGSNTCSKCKQKLPGKEGEETCLTIISSMVGKLIGRRGSNIEALEKFLGIKIKLIEENDPLFQYLHQRNSEEYPHNFYNDFSEQVEE